MMEYRRTCEAPEGSSQDLAVSTAKGVGMPVSTEHEGEDVEMVDAVQVAKTTVGDEENQFALVSRDELESSDHFSYSYEGRGHISEHPEECSKYINLIRGGASSPNPELDDIVDREGYDRSSAGLVGVIAEHNLTWKRLGKSLTRSRRLQMERDSLEAERNALKEERDSLKKERDSGNARVEALVREVESLKSGGIVKELETLKGRYQEERKMLNETAEMYHAEARKRAAAEKKCDDTRDRLERAIEVNTALIEHVRTHIPRLRSSRSEHGLTCARKAAEKVRTELVGQAQTFVDQALSLVHKHYEGELEFRRLSSLASQTETQLEMISTFALDVEDDEVKARLEGYRKDAEALELTELSDGDFNFVPEVIALSESYDEDIPKSPLGEDCGIKRGWSVDFLSEWFDPALCEEEEGDQNEERAVRSEQGAESQAKDVEAEQIAEDVLATMLLDSSRSVAIVEQFVFSVILEVVEKLMNEIADRVVAETTAANPTPTEISAKDPEVNASDAVDQPEGETVAEDQMTGDDLDPLFVQNPSALMPIDPRPE